MLSYFDWYLVELELRLAKSVSTQQLETILAETRSHLMESATRFAGETGADEGVAAKAAIDAYGTPNLVAVGYLRESKPRFLGMKADWAVLLYAFAAIFAWDFAWLTMNGPFDNFGETWQNGIAAIACAVATVLFAKACHASRRWQAPRVATFTGAFALSLIFIISFWIVGDNDTMQVVSRFHLSRDIAQLKSTNRRLEGLKAYLKEGSQFFSKASPGTPLPASFTSEEEAYHRLDLGNTTAFPPAVWHFADKSEGEFLVPSRFIYAVVDGRIWSLERVMTLAEAKAIWRERAAAAIASTERNQERLASLLGHAQEATSGRLFYFNRRVYRPVIDWTLGFLPFLLAADLIAYRIGRRRTLWRRRAMA